MKNRLKNITRSILSNEWRTLYKVNFDFLFKDGKWKNLSRETYDRGSGTCILLYNKEKGTVILTKQFCMAVYNENSSEEGMSIEVCAGSIDDNENPDDCVIREVKEEVGYEIKEVKRVFETYISPGATTEKSYMYVAEYTEDMKVDSGGGVEEEGEEIEVLELSFSKVLLMIENKEIKDARSIMLLLYAQLHKLLE
ncbi:NUDIX domain-containing protein [uncultured Tenacibaculum sp.]|uniref:NUDIX domain-containing protein n=1 Tax=uncultured Tenacibaculum sp. TaxID=174713 RepID=UPI0026213F92|nr:NUDIX domain-containing protein [uncultured Tenacibaculum sp.]